MNFRHAAAAAATSFLFASLLTASNAMAQDADRTRFRGGVALEGGPFIVPSVVTIGSVNVVGVLGAQIDRNWGVYAIPYLGGLVGQVGGVSLGTGALVDYTMDDAVSVGAGLELGAFLGASSSCTTTGAVNGCNDTFSAAGGAFYGARLRFAYHPFVSGVGTRRRKAFSLGVDLRLLEGPFASTTSGPNGNSTTTGSLDSFIVAPMAWLGYTAF